VELEGKLLGLAGCGRVGKLVARMALGIGMEVIAFDPYPDAAFLPGAGFQFKPLDEVMEKADFLSLHCPPRADGQPLIDARTIARMKPGVFVINTARYELLESQAVLAALDSGQIAGLALDVFETEPPIDFALAGHPRVIATPHIGGFTRESIDCAMTVSVDNLLAALDGI
jgi:phosphoglycerate dehydrogenase-like enzyme